MDMAVNFENSGASLKPPQRSSLLNMDEVKIDPAWAYRLPANLARRRQVLPFAMVDNTVYIACLKVQDAATLQAVKRHIGRRVSAELAEPRSLQRAIDRVYLDSPSSQVDENSDDAVSLCEQILQAAILRRASDIHIDSRRDGVSIRFRVDGQLETFRSRLSSASTMISRFMVLAGMDIAEKRASQDGRIQYSFGKNQELNLRVAMLPAKQGERLTLRMLALQTESLTLERLGLSSADLERFDAVLGLSHGLVLVTGPTGSGKSTTLYAAIRRLLQGEAKSIITVEDPVEYEMDDITQVEVDSSDKVSFASALRSLLRHDPDVIMIGEMRDSESADIAVKSALTGHLVFSSLHTNSAAAVALRLQDMGVDPYLIAATLRLAVAQRLVRRLCSRCRKPQPLDESSRRILGLPKEAEDMSYVAQGCMYCAGRGIVGRTGLFEMIRFDESWEPLLAKGIDQARIKEELRRRRLPTLRDDALSKLKAGITTREDVLRVLSQA